MPARPFKFNLGQGTQIVKWNRQRRGATGNNTAVHTAQIPNWNSQMRALVFLLRAGRHPGRERWRRRRLVSCHTPWGWRRSQAWTSTWRRQKEAWRSWCWGGSWRRRRPSSSTTGTSRTGFKASLRESKPTHTHGSRRVAEKKRSWHFIQLHLDISAACCSFLIRPRHAGDSDGSKTLNYEVLQKLPS